MPAPFADRLHAAIAEKRSAVCIGLDPNFDLFPDELRLGDGAPFHILDPSGLLHRAAAVRLFCLGVFDAVEDITPVVKFQIAYFEKLHGYGVSLYYQLVAEAQRRGLLVIGDVKRGDIGATSEAYAAAHLADLPAGSSELPAATPDAITVNPYLGLDTIEPFLAVCREQHKGVFVLVRTSNPGSADLQDLRTETGETFAEMIATKLNAINPANGDGDYGDYGPIGAVVGATQPQTMESLRIRMPRSIFLLPGYGTQGATADMTRAAFDSDGRGAIVSASRSVLYPKREPGEAWQDAVRRAAVAMRDDLATLR